MTRTALNEKINQIQFRSLAQVWLPSTTTCRWHCDFCRVQDNLALRDQMQDRTRALLQENWEEVELAFFFIGAVEDALNAQG